METVTIPRVVTVRLAGDKEVQGRLIGSENGVLFVAAEAEYQRAVASDDEPRTLGFAPEFVSEACPGGCGSRGDAALRRLEGGEQQ